MYQKIILYTLFPVFFQIYQIFQEKLPTQYRVMDSPFTFIEQEIWVDSVFNKMTLNDKIGQLFMVAAYSNKDETHYKEIDNLIKENRIGGVIFFQGSPYKQAILTNRYQQKSKIPLLIAIDAEWGLGMRLDSTLSYPYQITLGAIQSSDSLIEAMGEQIGEQCNRLGIHINFAPVVDINSNPDNPVIGFRSFGENKVKVVQKGIAYMKGMQRKGVMAVAKHFPGHGDTDADSHHTLPLLQHTAQRLDSIELYPFQKLIQAGIQGVMVAHLQIPAYENRPNYPTTLSEKVVRELLIMKMGFKGLVFTDALNMKGVSAYFKPGEADMLALLAGNDVLLFSGDVPMATSLIKKALKKKKIKKKDFENSVRKILRAKYQAGLHAYYPVATANLHQDLHKPTYQNLIKNLYSKAVTVLPATDSLLPFKHLEMHSFTSLSINGQGEDMVNMQEMFDNYAYFKHYNIQTRNVAQPTYQKVIESIDSSETLVVSVLGMSRLASKKFGIDSITIKIVEELAKKHKKIVLCLYGNPYALQFFDGIKNVCVAYEENPITLLQVPQILFGAIGASGRLPVSLHNLREGEGLELSMLMRLQYGFSPESVGMSSDTLQKMDTLIQSAINGRVFPGCQVLVARNGKVIWNKAYGYHTYASTRKVTTQTLYDLASVSKVAGTAQTLMFLFDVGLLDLSLKASDYLPELEKSNKKNLFVHDLMLHQAGLTPYILYYKKTLGKLREPSPTYYRDTPSDTFCLQVAPHLFANKQMEQDMWQWTLKSELLKKKKKRYPYEYSDLSFYFLKRIAEKQLKQPMDKFLRQNFYLPLGAYRLTYKPLETFSPEQIAPTEEDRYFRKELLIGTVHDPGAAMMGGVGGHAGLFGNTNDLAKLLQMNLQGGYYGGVRYLVAETIKLFTSQTDSLNRRGLGWDKPDTGAVYGYISKYASAESYGHSGYTGTVAWVEPSEQLVMIILSNRVHPYDNTRIIKQHTRRKILDIVYEAIIDKKHL